MHGIIWFHSNGSKGTLVGIKLSDRGTLVLFDQGSGYFGHVVLIPLLTTVFLKPERLVRMHEYDTATTVTMRS